jgi:hypothetical protein
MEFVESSIFTERVTKLLSDEAYRALQGVLSEEPRAGDVIPGAGGLRKFRWRSASRGKRGGLRVIYYCWTKDRLYMVFVYDKTKQGDLTPDQLRILRASVKEGLLCEPRISGRY